MSDLARPARPPGISGPVLLFVALWALTRIVPMLPVVFPGSGRVVLTEVDPLFHARHAEFTARHFPDLLREDPGSHYPGIEFADVLGLYDVALGGAAWTISLGKPGPEIVQRVAAWSPVVISAVAVALLMFAVNWMAGRGAAAVTGLLLLGLPGSAGARSLLGYADQHVVEFTLIVATLFSATAATRRAARPDPAGSGSSVRSTWLRAPLYGLSPALLLYSWLGSPLYIAIFGSATCIAALLVLASEHDHRPFFTGMGSLFAGLTLWQVVVRCGWPELRAEFIPGVSDWTLGATFLAALLLPIADLAFERFTVSPGDRRAGSAGLAIGLAACVYLFAAKTGSGQVFWHWATSARGADVSEQQPVALLDLWRLHGPAHVAAAAGLVCAAVRSGWSRGPALFMALCGALLTTTWVATHDFDYAGPFLVLGTAALALDHLGRRLRAVAQRGVRGARPAVSRLARWLRFAPAIAVAGVAFVPGLGVRHPWPNELEVFDGMAGSAAWYEAMEWLHDHSPQPTVSPIDIAPARDSLGWSPGTYGVMTPWEAGNTVALVARRLPVASRYPSAADAAWMAETGEAASLPLLCPACGPGEGVVYAAVDAERSGPALVTKMRLVGREPGLIPAEPFVVGNRSVQSYRFDSTYTRSMAYRLYWEDGSGLSHYRLVYEATRPWYSAYAFDLGDRALEVASRPIPDSSAVRWTAGVQVGRPALSGRKLLHDHLVSPAVKVFRIVNGARLVGRAPAGTAVAARLNLVAGSTGRRIPYEQRAVADAAGRYQLLLPYPTRSDTAWTDVRADGPWHIVVARDGILWQLAVDVTEEQVTMGSVVQVPDTF